MSRIDRLPASKDDIVDIASYIGKENPLAADQFIEAVNADFARLADAPGIGSPRNFKNPLLAEVRSWTVRGFQQYLIFYRPTETGIEVIRVIHGARNLRRIFGREARKRRSIKPCG